MSPADSTIDVRLVPSTLLARPGERIAYSLVNHGTGVIMFGNRFCVERREHDQWVGSGPDRAVRAIGYGLQPGEQRELSLPVPEDALPGRYRVSKSVSVNPNVDVDASSVVRASAWAVHAKPGGRQETVSFEFDVVGA